MVGVFWWVFVAVWGATMLAFPVIKAMPAGYVPVVLGAGIGVVLLRFAPPFVARLATYPAPRFLTLVLLLATALRIAAVLFFPLEPRADDEQFHRYAVAMLSGQGYGTPGFRAWFPPGMSLLLTAWYWLTAASPLAGKLLHVLLGVALTWQVWAFARMFTSETTARVAMLLVALFPTLVFYTATLGYETLLALLVVIVCRIALVVARTPRPLVLHLVGLGLCLGVGALVKPICLLVPALLAASWWLLGMPALRAIVRGALVAIVLLLTIAPWTLRNYRVLGEFVPISTNGGYTLYSANNPEATGLAMPVTPLPGERDEVSRDRLRSRAAFDWIVHNPAAWFRLALAKATYTWGTTSSIMAVVSTDRLPPSIENVCKFLLNVAWGALFVWCAAATRRARTWTDGFLLPTLFVAYIFGLHLFFEAHSRHHLPVLPLLCIVGAVALTQQTTFASLDQSRQRRDHSDAPV
ncbi:MAG: glycosyltransferase family 39 protein [Vicinamibacterales bacterium]